MTQTRPFPSIHQVERSWEQNIRAALDLLAPGSGIRSGLRLGFPLSSGQPTTGLVPTLTDGYLVQGDQVLGPYGSKLISAAPQNVANRKLFFGLEGLYYAGSANTPNDARDYLIGEVTTNNGSPASIITVGQPLNYGAGRFGVRGLVNLAQAADGADTNIFTWAMPAGFEFARLTYAHARVATVVTAGNTSGDDFLLKLKVDAANAITLATIAAADSVTLNHMVRATADDGDAYTFRNPTNLVFQYNQTDTSTAIAGGTIEIIALLECF